MTNTLLSSGERLLMLGLIDAEGVASIGSSAVEFGGRPVRVIQSGGVAALVSPAPEPLRLTRWLTLPARPVRLMPIVSALSSLVPILPVAPDTIFEGEEKLQCMLQAREAELCELIGAHAGLLECDLVAGFDNEAAEHDLLANSALAALHGEAGAEQILIERSLKQSIDGRRATFLARLNRCIIESAIDALPIESGDPGVALRRRILISRAARAPFRDALLSLAENAGAGAWLRVSPYLPPVSFRRLEISSADPQQVALAREALGVAETAERSAIRIAYHRSIERCYPYSDCEPRRRRRLKRIEQQFGLLELVAEGQLRARHGGETAIRFNEEALNETWLIRLHTPDLSRRAA